METKEIPQIAIMQVSVSEWNETKKQIAEIVGLLRETADNKSEYLTPKEVCEMLKIGRATFERHKTNGLLPVYSIAGAKRKYAKKSEVLRLLSEGKF
ncbi:hypothetical protein AGMMS49525_04500 [Bacteroidia bacterium]|nr:hypothetical protein AGMMS49525_04500 [Bacteroidia bacterium]